MFDEILDSNEDQNINEIKIEKKKRGRKKKEEILKIEMEQLKKLEEFNKKSQEEINPSYYGERNTFKNIQLAAFLTRYRNINSNYIKDNDNIIADGSRIIEEVKKMSDNEFGSYYHMMLRNINKEDIFDNFL